MAEERADERQKIAAYLHDDLAQVLFRLSIQVDVARKLLDKGDHVETGTSWRRSASPSRTRRTASAR